MGMAARACHLVEVQLREVRRVAGCELAIERGVSFFFFEHLGSGRHRQEGNERPTSCQDLLSATPPTPLASRPQRSALAVGALRKKNRKEDKKGSALAPRSAAASGPTAGVDPPCGAGIYF